MASATVVNVHPDGSWEFEGQNEDSMKAVVDHLVNSKMLETAKTYCADFAKKYKSKNSPTVLPIILMPYGDTNNPDKDSREVAKSDVPNTEVKEELNKKVKKTVQYGKSNFHAEKKPYVYQRLKDFDLLSQW